MATISPKERFLKTKDAKFLAELVTNPSFLNCLSVALSEVQIAPPKQDSDAASNWHRLEGAKRFIETLISLPEPKRRTTIKSNDNLQPTT